jgi:hypothetical protein
VRAGREIGVGDHPVDLLGHVPVAAPQAGLDVSALPGCRSFKKNWRRDAAAMVEFTSPTTLTMRGL